MVEDLANTAARAKAAGGTCVASPKAAHMATTAYGDQAARKPMHTATDSCGEGAFTHMHADIQTTLNKKHDMQNLVSC